MKKIAIIAVALATFMTASAANAATRVYTISNGTFDDGNTFGGSFGYDDVNNSYYSVDIISHDGAKRSNVYTTNDVVAGFPLLLSLNNDDFNDFLIMFSNSLSDVTFSSPVSVTGLEFYDTGGSLRFVTSGAVNLDEVASAVPEPATWLTMILGFAMVGSAARYRRRTTKIAYA